MRGARQTKNQVKIALSTSPADLFHGSRITPTNHWSLPGSYCREWLIEYVRINNESPGPQRAETECTQTHLIVPLANVFVWGTSLENTLGVNMSWRTPRQIHQSIKVAAGNGSTHYGSKRAEASII